jgi:hypothetical protein
LCIFNRTIGSSVNDLMVWEVSHETNVSFVSYLKVLQFS